MLFDVVHRQRSPSRRGDRSSWYPHVRDTVSIANPDLFEMIGVALLVHIAGSMRLTRSLCFANHHPIHMLTENSRRIG